MTKSNSKSQNYQALKSELNTIMNELQRSDIDVDDALKNYKRGLEVVKLLDQYLDGAENSVIELKAKFNTSAK